MSLYNEYKNKNLFFLLKYLNNIDNYEKWTEEEISSFLLGKDKKLTSENIVQCILNQDMGGKNTSKKRQRSRENLNLLRNNQGELEPVIDLKGDRLPEALTEAERAWLKAVLSDKRSDMFFRSPYAKEKLLRALKDEMDISRHIVVRGGEISHEKPKNQLDDIIKNITDAYCEKYAVELKIGSEKHVMYPHKVFYSETTGSLVLHALEQDDNGTYKLQIVDFQDILLAELSSNDFPENFEEEVSKAYAEHKKEPVQLEIIVNKKDTDRGTMADDRCSLLFSNFETECLRIENGNMVLSINYYDFQYDEVIRKILFLGRFARVLGPSEVRDAVIAKLKNKLALYNNDKH